METSLTILIGFAAWLLKTSCQCSVVIGLVLLAQWLFQKQLAPRWRYALWLLVLLRLMLPVSPESPFSIFNYTQASRWAGSRSSTTKVSVNDRSTRQADPPATGAGSTTAESHSAGADASATAAALDSAIPAAPSKQTPFARKENADTTAPAPIGASSNDKTVESASGALVSGLEVPNYSSPRQRLRSWRVVMSVVWLAGALMLLARIVVFPLRLNAQLAQHEMAAGPGAFEVLEQAKRLVGINKVLPIVQSRAVASPALLGFIRPWLLLPDGLVERFTPEELRFVFLHELAHLKRRDIAVNWLMTLLQILHWFNPLVWFAFARMRADRELACDELALSFAKADENKSYGQAIIKLLEGFTRPAVLPGLVGILEDKQQMKRRITMIAQFKQMNSWPAVAFALLLTLGLVTLTDAQSEKDKDSPRSTDVAQEDAKPNVKVLLSGTGQDSIGTLSPDELKVAYIDWQKHGGDLAVKDLKTGQVTKLTASDSTNKYQYAIDPIWSPDSKSIAYNWDDHLTIVSLETHQSKSLNLAPGLYVVPQDWSKDGKYILGEILKEDHSLALSIITVESGEYRQIVSLGWNAPRHARFSSDGKHIVYDRTESGNRDVHLLAVNGTHAARLTQSPSEDGSALFSADGKYVLFSSNRRGSWDLWGVAIENGKATGDPFPVKYDFGDREKRLTASGKIAFTILGGGNDVYEVAVDGASGEMGAPKPIAKSYFGQNGWPAWSPDGTAVAYFQMRSGQGIQGSRLCLQTLADGREETIDTGMQYISQIFWSPDSKSLGLSGAGPNGQNGVYLFQLAQRELIRGRIGFPIPLGFSADGAEFISFKEDQNEHVAIHLETRQERKFTVAEGFDPAISSNFGPEYDITRDRARIVYVPREPVGKQRELVVADLQFKDKRVIARAGESESMTQPRWSPDGSKIAYYFLTKEQAFSIELRVIGADGRHPQTLNTGKKWIFGSPMWSPDGTKLALQLREDVVNEIGVLDNFLPKEKVENRAASAPVRSSEPIAKTLVSAPNFSGNLSPDESKVVYGVSTAESSDLWVKDLTTQKTTQLTKHDTNRTENIYEIQMSPVWSPDSKWIAYGLLLDGHVIQDYSVRIVAAEGGGSRMVKSNTEMWFEPDDWSQDGKSLLCVLHKVVGNSMALGLVSVESGEVRQLISLGWNAVRHARFSPDGKAIVYEREENGNRDIYMLALDGMRLTRLTDLPSDETSPVWSPDGKSVLFSSDRSGPPDLWAVRVANGEAVDTPFLVKRGFGGQDYRTARDGKLIFERAGGVARDCYNFAVDPATGNVTGPPKLMTKSFFGQQKCPIYSPVGKRLAYIRNRATLCVQSLGDGTEETFQPDMQYFNRIFWSPDSKTIALQGRGRTGPLGIHLFSLETRELTQLAADHAGVGNPKGFSADGKEFLFSRSEGQHWPFPSEHVAVELATKKDRPIDPPMKSDRIEEWASSPDGRQLAYVEKEANGPGRKLAVADAGFKETKTIATGSGSFFYLRWSPDGKAIAYHHSDKEDAAFSHTELRVVASDGSWQKTPNTGKLKIFSTGTPGSWSADGTKLALTLSEPTPGEIGVLENFLPKKEVAAAK